MNPPEGAQGPLGGTQGKGLSGWGGRPGPLHPAWSRVWLPWGKRVRSPEPRKSGQCASRSGLGGHGGTGGKGSSTHRAWAVSREAAAFAACRTEQAGTEAPAQHPSPRLAEFRLRVPPAPKRKPRGGRRWAQQVLAAVRGPGLGSGTGCSYGGDTGCGSPRTQGPSPALRQLLTARSAQAGRSGWVERAEWAPLGPVGGPQGTATPS